MNRSFCPNVNNSDYRKHCLLKYITLPFWSPPLYHRHQNMWQVPEMAAIIGQFGYNVDVINYDDTGTILTRQYDLLIDIYPQNKSVYRHHLADGCLKVLYSTGAGPEWQNRQQTLRVQSLNARRASSLLPKALVPPFGSEITDFDAMFLIGNEVTLSTYGELPIRKIFFITNSAWHFPDNDVSQKSPTTFLYLATYPQTLKGLDLLLEVFSRNPALSLVVAGQYEAERDFCAIYEQELYASPNILPVGVVDVTSKVFHKIRQIASYIILPSCSEGMSGSILTGMSAGLIPIVSPYCGLDDNAAFHLRDCSIDCIADTVSAFARKPLGWIKAESQRAVETIRTRYAPQHFSQSFRAAMEGLLEVSQ